MAEENCETNRRTYAREYRGERREKRLHNRELSTKRLLDAGVNFKARNEDNHLIINNNGEKIDFYPTTGLWKVRNTSIRDRGVRGLITYIKKGRP